MAVSRISSISAEANTASWGTHAAGDLLVVFAFRDGSTTNPTLPAGYTSISSADGTSCSIRMGYKIATGASETFGTWTNATLVIGHVYRGTKAIGKINATAGTGTSITFATISMYNGNGDSWAAGFFGHRSIDTTPTTAPSGMSNVNSVTGATADGGSHDTNAGVASWTSTAANVGGTSSNWVSIVLELVPDTVPYLVKEATAGGNSNSDPQTVTFASSVAVGSTVIMVINTSTVPTLNSVTDTGGNTYTAIAGPLSTGSENFYYYYAKVASSFTQISIDFSTSGWGFTVIAREYAGLDTSSPFDKNAHAAQSSVTTYDSGNTTTTSQANELLIGFAGNGNTAAGPWTVGTDYSDLVNNNGSTAFNTAMEHRLVTSTGTYNATFGTDVGSGYAAIATFKALLPNYSQASYRFYADGTESGSSALQNQDTNHTADVSSGDVNLQLRLRLQNSTTLAGASTDDYQLQYELNDSGTYINVSSIIASYSESNFTGNVTLNASQSKVGQGFAGTGAKTGTAKLYLKKTGSPTGTANVKIYAHSGTFGTTGVPTGSALAVSDDFDVSTLTTSNALVTFTFTGANQITVAQGTNYFITVEYGGGDGSNRVDVGVDGSPSYVSNYAYYDGSWHSLADQDLCFYLYPLTTPILPQDSTNLTDGNATTNRLGSGTGSFVAGEISEDGLVDNLEITASNYTELLYSLTVDSDSVADNDTIDFRVLLNGATTYMTYSVTPRITIEEAAAGSVKDIIGTGIIPFAR